MIKDDSIQQFLDDLASKSSTPGGGSAAAIIGTMGAALVSMIANLTIGKKNYESVESKMKELLDQSEEIRRRLIELVQADITVFNQVMDSYAMPRDTEVEKQQRSEAVQKALIAATEVPLNCAGLCAEIIELSAQVAESGNLNVISDAGVAALSGHAALRSAALNVSINLANIKDDEFVKDRHAQLERIVNGCGKRTEEVYNLVVDKLK